VSALAGWEILAGVAVAAGPAASPNCLGDRCIALTLSPATIVADGKSTISAIAMVTDAQGKPVSTASVSFTSTSGQSVGKTKNQGGGTYTATITSTTTAGTAKIKAMTASGASAAATLTQVAGPAANVALQLSPSAIVADGASTSTATATVTDAFGNPVPVAPITFSSTDTGVRFSPVNNNGNGTYTTTLTSSKTPGTPTISAIDPPLAPAVKPLTLVTPTLGGPGGTVTVSAFPATPVTNQVMILIAIVTADGGGPAPSGTITFEDHGTPIAGCANQPALAQATQRLSQSTCQVSFSASRSPEQLEAVFTGSSPNVVETSTTATVTVGPSDTSTTLDVSSLTVNVRSATTFTARVTPSNLGRAAPAGSVDFFDGTQPITACSGRPLSSAAGSSTATCTTSFTAPGWHSITARYRGDADFTGSRSAPQPVAVRRPPLGTIKSTLQWAFFYTPDYTKIPAFVVHNAPVGATVAITCHGGGCPFTKRVDSVRRSKLCKSTHSHRCLVPHPVNVNLQPGFQNARLMIGAQVAVTITRSRWIGKYYLFTVREGRGPLIRIDCLAPGGARPGVGC